MQHPPTDRSAPERIPTSAVVAHLEIVAPLLEGRFAGTPLVVPEKAPRMPSPYRRTDIGG